MIKAKCIFKLNFIVILFFVFNNVFGIQRGPHHPKSEVSNTKNKLDSHLTYEEHNIREEIKDYAAELNPDLMTDEEKHFFYFKSHDVDNNNALDGLELLHAAIHQENKSENSFIDDNDVNEDDEFNHIIGVIDQLLVNADKNKDGLLNYPEYMKAINENKL